VVGCGAVALGRDPNGLANLLFAGGRWARREFDGLSPGLSLRRGGDEAADQPADPSGAQSVEEVPVHAAS
jgi:branched-chain amino acid transport system permease protein